MPQASIDGKVIYYDEITISAGATCCVTDSNGIIAGQLGRYPDGSIIQPRVVRTDAKTWVFVEGPKPGMDYVHVYDDILPTRDPLEFPQLPGGMLPWGAEKPNPTKSRYQLELEDKVEKLETQYRLEVMAGADRGRLFGVQRRLQQAREELRKFEVELEQMRTQPIRIPFNPLVGGIDFATGITNATDDPKSKGLTAAEVQRVMDKMRKFDEDDEAFDKAERDRIIEERIELIRQKAAEEKRAEMQQLMQRVARGQDVDEFDKIEILVCSACNALTPVWYEPGRYCVQCFRSPENRGENKREQVLVLWYADGTKRRVRLRSLRSVTFVDPPPGEARPEARPNPILGGNRKIRGN